MTLVRLTLAIGIGAALLWPAVLIGDDEPKSPPPEQPPETKPEPGARDAAPKPGDEQKPAARKPQIGDAAPAFELKGSDGKTYKSADYNDKTLVLEWFRRDCPTCRKQLASLKKTSESYAKKGVTWLAVDSTHNQKSAANTEFAKKESLPHPILEDFDGKLGKAIGAERTPHIFVIRKGKLVYMGSLLRQGDDRNYVAEALDAVLEGKEPPVAKTSPYG